MVLHRTGNTENIKFCSEFKMVLAMADRIKQKNLKLKRAAQSCSKLIDLLKKSTPDYQSSTNESLDDVTDKGSGEQK